MTGATGRWVGPELARRRRVICIGNFDGVHRGHQRLIRRGQTLAKELGVSGLTALSFWPPPSRFFHQECDLQLLSTPKERVELLSKAGVSEPLFLPFDQTVAELPAQTFVAQILVKELEAIGVVVGTDFRFGTKRLGDTELLRSVLAETGAVLDVVTKVEEDNAAISSSRIRQSIGSGCFDEALALLGHGYPVSGQVVPGDQRGREIGFPTANLQIHRDKLLPQPGVYGGTTTLKNERLPVIVNVGTRPTFKAESVLGVEAHVIDAPPDLDLYGHTLTLHLDYHLRDERRFASVEALTKQITLDIEALQRQFR